MQEAVTVETTTWRHRWLGKSRVRQHITTEDILAWSLLVLVGILLFVFLVYPLSQTLWRSLHDNQGNFVGLRNYAAYFASPTTSASFRHSMFIATVSMVITVFLAFLYAYGLTRMVIPGKGALRLIAMLPMFTPSLVQALAFIYVFGNNGIFTRATGINIHLYGPVGIILSEVYYAFPHALLILIAALMMADRRIYEAAEVLRASAWRVFVTVTLPAVKYGLISACFVVFTLAITDFGAPKVIGGNYDVLATDIYNKVVGQQNFTMGATISTLLLIPALIAFVLNQIVQRRQVAQVTANITPMGPKRHHPIAQWTVFLFSVAIAAFIISIYVVVVVGAFVKNWPYDFSFTLRNFTFYTMGGYSVLWNSIRMAVGTAVGGTIIVFTSAYLIEKTRGVRWLRSVLYLLSLMPLAVPGMVLGLSYIFVFNNPDSPLNVLYGTMTILVISTIIHYYTVPFLTASTTLKQIDPEFESISASLRAPFYRTFWRVTVPIALPSILSIAMYFFLNAMVTLSAVVFLFVPGNELAALAVMLLDDAGESAQAMAMSFLIILIGLTARGVFYLLTRGVEQKTQAWRQR